MSTFIWRVRDLNATNPDDYSPNSFDVAVYDGELIAYSDEVFSTHDAAAVALAGLEHAGLPACLADGRLIDAKEHAA